MTLQGAREHVYPVQYWMPLLGIAGLKLTNHQAPMLSLVPRLHYPVFYLPVFSNVCQNTGVVGPGNEAIVVCKTIRFGARL